MDATYLEKWTPIVADFKQEIQELVAKVALLYPWNDTISIDEYEYLVEKYFYDQKIIEEAKVIANLTGMPKG